MDEPLTALVLLKCGQVQSFLNMPQDDRLIIAMRIKAYLILLINFSNYGFIR